MCSHCQEDFFLLTPRRMASNPLNRSAGASFVPPRLCLFLLASKKKNKTTQTSQPHCFLVCACKDKMHSLSLICVSNETKNFKNLLKVQTQSINSLKKCQLFYLQMAQESCCNPNKAFEQMFLNAHCYVIMHLVLSIRPM